MSSIPFPFTAIVGQDEMKNALICASLDRRLGGVLIFGDRGTGKSTAVRALAALLPPMRAVADCRFACDPETPASWCSECIERHGGKKKPKLRTVPVPVVDMPLGVTEDRVVGALDIERALTQGVKAFEPGLLARANRGFLYIDEVNLLEDHLVDLLIDAAASGENLVEREGLSLKHPASFVLVGSGNPEEGELRPQLLDRFGLSVEVSTPVAIQERMSIVKRRDEFDRNREEFAARWKAEDEALQRRIAKSRLRLDRVTTSEPVLEALTRLCMHLGTDGLRAELTLMRAARALACFEGARAVELSHVRRMAAPALRHRLRRDPLDEAGSSVRIERALSEVLPA